MINESLLSTMKKWKVGNHIKYCLGADVGGSGIRFILSNYHNENQFIEHEHIKAKNSNDIYQAVNSLNTTIQKLHSKSQCCGSTFAIAGLRKSKDTVSLLNWPGPDSNRTIDVRKFPKTIYPEHHSILLNDLEACVYGIIYYNNQKKSHEYFEKLWGPSNSLISKTNTAVLAMGTGLGGALITHDSISQRSFAVPTEMGFLQAIQEGDNYPGIEEERKIIQYTSNHLYGGKHMPIYENLASGRGMVITYQYLLQNQKNSKAIQNNIQNHSINQKTITALDITNLAKNGDKIALEAMKRHYLFFTRCAKAFASSLKCESVIMALSNQVTNRWFVHTIIPEMELEFKNFTKPDWMKNISVWAQKKDINFNLLGTSYISKMIADTNI